MHLHVVPISVKSYRLLAMSMDDDGFIWTGSTHRVLHRYDPRTGAVENVPLPYEATASACLCVRDQVYVLGQTYPRLITYDRSAGTFRETAYPSSKPDVWYGLVGLRGEALYLFDRGSVGIVRWDTCSNTGAAIDYSYPTPLPSGGSYEEADGAIWCRLWDYTDGKYRPVGLARFAVDEDRFTGWWPFPEAEDGLDEFADPAHTLFLPYSLRGQIVPFDLREKRWRRSITVPEYGERFAFMGGPTPHAGRCYFSLSTYNGTNVGCDGLPYHFCNAILEFDPVARQTRFLTLERPEGYYQISYMLSAGGQFYATGSNIREADGTLNQARAGEAIFWQTSPTQ